MSHLRAHLPVPLLGFLLIFSAQVANAEQLLRFGVLAYRSDAEMVRRFQPLADYLSTKVAGIRVILEPLSMAELQQAVDRHEVDLVLTNPRHYMRLRSRNELTGVMATMVKRAANGSATAYLGGVILSRADRADLASLADLRRQRIAVPHTDNTGGYLAPVVELYAAGLPLPPTEQLLIAGTHDAVVDMVLSGAADVGFIRTEILEELIAEGRVPADGLKVINRQQLPDFPFTSSTRLYPEWPVIALPHVDVRSRSLVMAALLALDPEDPVARQAQIAGFIPPADYWPVERAMQGLRLPPFDTLQAYTLADVWRDHRHGVVGGLLALVAIVMLSLGLARRNRALAVQSRTLVDAAQQQRHARLTQVVIAEAITALTRADVSQRDQAIDALLEAAGQRLEADRAYLFQLDTDGAHFSNTHEWCAPGVRGERHRNQHVAIVDTGWWWGELSRRGLVLIDDVEQLTASAADFRSMLQRQGIRSLCGLPLLKDEANYGFIGFDMVRCRHRWREDEILPFQTLATGLGNALKRWQAEARLAESRNFLNTLFESIPTPVFFKDRDGRYQGVNRTFETFFGADRAALLGNTAADISPPELARVYSAQDARLFAAGGVQCYESQVKNARGELRDVIFHKAVFNGADGQAAGLIGTVTDVTDSKQQQRLLVLRAKRDEALLALPHLAERVDESDFLQRGLALAEKLTDSRIAFIHFVDEAAGTIELVTWSLRTLTDYCEATYDRHYPVRDAGIWADALRKRAAVVCNDYAAHTGKHGLPSGHAALARLVTVPVIEDARVVMLCGVGNAPDAYDATDVETLQLIANELWRISQRRRSLAALQRSANVFIHAREGILIAASDGTIVDVNAAMTEIIGYERDELIGKNPRLFRSPRHGQPFYEALWAALNEHGYWRGEIWNQRKDGSLTALLLTISAVGQGDGRPRQFVALYSDINAIKDYQRRLEHIAHYDALTDLPNRVLLSRRLREAMAAADRDGTRLAVLYVDLDGFKAINDRHGHDCGDQVLRALAARMRVAVPDADGVGRLGGDEFAVVLAGLPLDGAAPPEIQRLLDALVQPIQLDGQRFQVSASIGVTSYPQPGGADADLLLRQADYAMYQAKQAGRNRFVLFDEEDERHQAGRRRVQQQIALGLRRGEFVFAFQPKVNMRSGEVLGAECLVRWQHPHRGCLAPHSFLHQITETSLMAKLGQQGVATALRQLALWHARGLALTLSVNLHAHHLLLPGFVDWLAAELARYSSVPRGALLLEVLESSALDDVARVGRVIEDCRDIGVDFSLDDFGTGYSSLTYLRSLPAVELKIDQSFVRDCLEDAGDLAILEGVLGLATAFRRRVVAEGVETLAHGEMLLALGCELGQGYAIARPMPVEAFESWLETWQTPQQWRTARPVAQDALPALFASVEHRAWVGAVERSIFGSSGGPPPDELHCRFSEWLADNGMQHFGDAAACQRVSEHHDLVHERAAELLALKARGDAAAAIARLPELRALRDALLQDLALLLSAPGSRRSCD
jgi:diguanylate cyclase (GGDEF)-like protein/PAS domain S-box-containing protein